MRDSDYDALVSASSSPETVTKAIGIYPSRVEGYEKLLSIYENDLTDENSEKLIAAIDSSIGILDPETPEYSGLMFRIGKAYLTKYKAGSARENIALAAPYLAQVKAGSAAIPSGYYVKLNGFINDYIIGGGGLLGTKEASSEDVLALCGDMDSLIEALGSYAGDDKAPLTITSSEIMISVIDSLSSEIKEPKETSAFVKTAELSKKQLEALHVRTESLAAEKEEAIIGAETVIAKLKGISREAAKGTGASAQPETKQPQERPAPAESDGIELGL
jgi:hypothetical protein